ncbi:MAG TPA: hypothetical protein VHY08_13005 [Bacillota bacterium]|nr:hypothetical protein [Bacillota bacterium]
MAAHPDSPSVYEYLKEVYGGWKLTDLAAKAAKIRADPQQQTETNAVVERFFIIESGIKKREGGRMMIP